jgi:hypothetical protein
VLKAGENWQEAKGLAFVRNKWKSFKKALCSTHEQKERMMM